MNHYEEEIAQQLLAEGNIDELIVYCIPTTHAYLKHHKWFFVTIENYEDVIQELCISMIKAIQKYTPDKGAKLLSWLYTNYRFTMLFLSKKEKIWQGDFVQLDEDSENLIGESDNGLSVN